VDTLVENAMERNVVTIDDKKTLNDALVIMNRENVGRLIVMRDGDKFSIITKIHAFNNLASYV